MSDYSNRVTVVDIQCSMVVSMAKQLPRPSSPSFFPA